MLSNRLKKPVLVLFTSFDYEDEKNITLTNSLKNWVSFLPVIKPVLFINRYFTEVANYASSLGWTVVTEYNTRSRVPLIKDMFFRAQQISNASFYGFSNADILYDDSLLKTLHALEPCAEALHRFLVVGRRTNVDVRKLPDPHLFTPADVKQALHSPSAQLFWPDVQDYFFIFRNDFIWSELPDLVVGRPGFDNFVVAKAWRSRLPVIDATLTLSALHQTDQHGNQAWKRRGDASLNWDVIGAFKYESGSTDKAQFETRLNEKSGCVEVWHRRVKKNPQRYQVQC